MTLSINWNKQPLGKMPDAKLAAELNCSWKSVFRARRRLGIAPFQPKGASRAPRKKQRNGSTKPNLKPIDWSLYPLGKDTDYAIARTIGCSVSAVRYQRVKRGLPFAKGKGDGPPRGVVSRLGKDPDTKIAKDLGVHFSTVRQWRVQRGIPSADHARRSRYADSKKLARILRANLVDDEVLAKLLGLTLSRVHEVRRKYNIRLQHHRHTCFCGEPTNQGGRFCSKACSKRASFGAQSCKLSSEKHRAELDGLFWALAMLNLSITKKTGAIKNWRRSWSKNRGNESKTSSRQPHTGRSRRGRRTRRKAA